MKDWVQNLTYFISGLFVVIYSLYKFLTRQKKKKIKYDSIEKISAEIENLKHEKIREQKQVTRELSDILYGEIWDSCCNNLGLDNISDKAIIFNYYNISQFRDLTDGLIKETIYANNITMPDSREWDDYKEQKYKYILNKVLELSKRIYRKDWLEIDYDDFVEKCRDDFVEISKKYVYKMFEKMRYISQKYKKDIQERESLLDKIKNEKK